MNSTKQITIKDYFAVTCAKLEKAGKLSTCRNYRKTYLSFSKFEGASSMKMQDLCPEVLQRYNNFLYQNGIVRNTVSFYNRILRSVYNRAVKEGIVSWENNLFADVYTGVDKTVKKALDIDSLHKITSLDLSDEPELDFARDLFLFSLYARGMCFVDMAYLTHDSICIEDGTIRYIRSKTNQSLCIKLEPCMVSIIERYCRKCFADYVFPIIRSSDPAQAFKDYEYHLQRHNLLLKEIGMRCDISFPLSSYAARHSWATLARNANVPISIISAGMGHTSEKTTRIYLAELDQAVIDKANRSLLNSLMLK